MERLEGVVINIAEPAYAFAAAVIFKRQRKTSGQKGMRFSRKNKRLCNRLPAETKKDDLRIALSSGYSVLAPYDTVAHDQVRSSIHRLPVGHDITKACTGRRIVDYGFGERQIVLNSIGGKVDAGHYYMLPGRHGLRVTKAGRSSGVDGLKYRIAGIGHRLVVGSVYQCHAEGNLVRTVVECRIGLIAYLPATAFLSEQRAGCDQQQKDG